MPAITISNEVFSAALGPFTVQLKGEGICPAHFRNGCVYLGEYQLTPDQQKKFIDLFSEKYRSTRYRNYGWRFLSSCHTYFNGQLQEIQNQKTDEAKIRYLFCHAEKTPNSKTAEALQAVLPAFYATLSGGQFVSVISDVSAPAASTGEYVRKKTTHFMSEPSYQAVQKIPEAVLIMRSHCHDRHLQWMEEAFKGLWLFPSIQKTAAVNYDARYLKYYLLFYDDCRAAIMKNNPGFFSRYNPFDNTVEREIAEAEWAKRLYLSLDHFRRRVNSSNGVVSEIHSAFNELIEQIHVDPVNLDSAHLRDSEFHDAAINLRLQSIVIHMDWRKSVAEDKVAPLSAFPD